MIREALSHTDSRIVLLVDNRELPSPFEGVPIVYGSGGLRAWLADQKATTLHCVAAIGGARGRERVALLDEMVALGLAGCNVVHKTAFVASDAQMGDGVQIMALSAVCAHARLGRGVIVNTSASVDHDCVLGDGAHVAPGARLCGEVDVGTGAFVGAGAVILPRIHIGADAIVGAGAVVTRDVPIGATVTGNPARVRSVASPCKAERRNQG